MPVTRSTYFDRLLKPVHRWVWSDSDRRVRKLLAFAEVETDGGRDILRAAEITPDPLLRRLYLEHAIDELRHGDLFRERGSALLRRRGRSRATLFNGTPLPGGHGLDDLRIDGEPDYRLLAFLHVAEKSAAGRFTIYRDVVADDPETRAIFEQVLHDEVFHMNYTYTQLMRIAPASHAPHVWRARFSRVWNRYVRLAAAVAGLFGSAILTAIYFVVLPPFAWLAKRSSRREQAGWTPIAAQDDRSLTSQY
ncbi:MAG TPA: ferritin-like domain-containing protein [Vicinamibacterales bacterium]|nr:ferritin-like domain-containing protein [Vicinamibacterales bacterium]